MAGNKKNSRKAVFDIGLEQVYAACSLSERTAITGSGVAIVCISATCCGAFLALKVGAWEVARKRDGLRGGVLTYLTADAERMVHLLSGASVAKIEIKYFRRYSLLAEPILCGNIGLF